MKALVVDDSATMRRILMNILKTVGFEEVVQASDGSEAVASIDGHDFSLVLMDWNMPNMNGLEALKAIRLKTKDVPVFMVTTEAEQSRVLEALKAGANNYIIKPFKQDQVISKIQEFLSK